MNKFFQLMMLPIFMAPDGGDGGGSPTAPLADPTSISVSSGGTDPSPVPGPIKGTEPPPQSVPEMPKYFSQLDPTKRDSEDYKAYVGKHQTITDLADDYVATQKRLGKAIEIPGKDAKPDEIKAFFTHLGVPESAEGYETPDNGMPKEMAEQFKKTLTQEFIRAGMTKTQGKNMWDFFSKNITVGQQMIADNQKKQAQTFDARLSAKLQDTYPVQADRDGAMKEAVNLFKQHMSRTGLGKQYQKAGLIYDPEFILAIANDEKAHGGTYISGRTGGSENKGIGAFGSGYSPEFTDMVKGRK